LGSPQQMIYPKLVAAEGQKPQMKHGLSRMNFELCFIRGYLPAVLLNGGRKKQPACQEDKMGVMTRDRGEVFVITSDRSPDETQNKRAPKKMSSTYLVWTGDRWSAVMTDAKTFETLEAADEYIRANSGRVMKAG
jgi:hypothetical protein